MYIATAKVIFNAETLIFTEGVSGVKSVYIKYYVGSTVQLRIVYDSGVILSYLNCQAEFTQTPVI
jgi:hypothetical protein